MVHTIQTNVFSLLCVLLLTMSYSGCSVSVSKEENEVDKAVEDSLKELDQAMEEFNNRKKYSSLSVETLNSVPNDKLEQAIVDYIADKIYANGRNGKDLTILSEGCRALWLTWIVEGEVNNGGFNQLYWNTDDAHNAELVEAFEFFGAVEHAKLMARANNARAKEAKRQQKYKDENTLQAFSDSYKETDLGSFDTEFYDLTDDLSSLRIAKIRKTPELFVGD